MCGRFTVTAAPQEVAAELGATQLPMEFVPRWNVAPQQQVLAVLSEDGAPVARMLRWGLVPSWAKDPSIGNRMINARAETLREKPSYRSAFAKRRCVVLADGFYEWKATPGGKVPMYIRLPGGRPFAIAGLWECWRDGDAPLFTCTLITTGPNEHMRGIHDRMPVILQVDRARTWLDAASAVDALQELCAPYDGELESYAVSTLVNSPKNDLPECVAAL